MKALALLLFAIAANASAQFSMDWHTMDAGGGSGAAGTFTMDGTLGQPDTAAGVAGSIAFRGGYWALVDEPLPLLRIFEFEGEIILAWPDPSPGFVLQETPDLALPDWADVPSPPSLVGDEWMLNWGPPVGNHFFRLRRP